VFVSSRTPGRSINYQYTLKSGATSTKGKKNTNPRYNHVSSATSCDDMVLNHQNKKYKNLLQWIREIPGSYIGPVEILPSTRGGGFGVFTTKSVQTHEILFIIPREACISIDTVLADEGVGHLQYFRDILGTVVPRKVSVVLAGWIAKEWMLSSISLALNSGQSEKNKYLSFFFDYLQTLPWNSGDQEHILFWSDEEISSYFKGSFAEGDVLSLRAELEFGKDVIFPIVHRSIRKEAPPFFMPRADSSAFNKDADILNKTVTGVFVSLLSRAFQLEDTRHAADCESQVLIPLLDMLQHSNTPTIIYFMDSTNGDVQVRAIKQIDAGQELFNKYAEEENTHAYKFFNRYGFLPGRSPQSARELLQTKKSDIFH